MVDSTRRAWLNMLRNLFNGPYEDKMNVEFFHYRKTLMHALACQMYDAGRLYEMKPMFNNLTVNSIRNTILDQITDEYERLENENEGPYGVNGSTRPL